MQTAVDLGAKYFGIGSIVNGYTSDPQPWDFSTAKQQLDFLQDHGITPIVGFDPWPTDAENADSEHAQYGFDAKVTAFVKNFSGRGIIWQGLNEANGDDGHPHWFGRDIRFDKQAFNDWLDYDRRMNSIVQKYDPGAVFLTLDFYNTIAFNETDRMNHIWSQALEAGIQETGDALSIHPYNWDNNGHFNGTPEDVFKAMQPDKRVTLPMVTTEFGFRRDVVGDELQADYNLRELFLLDLLGHSIITTYKAFGTQPDSDDGYALATPQGMRPVGKLMQQLIMHDLNGFTCFERVTTPSAGDYVLRYVGATGDKFVYWTVDDKHNVNHLDIPLELTSTPKVSKLIDMEAFGSARSPFAMIMNNARRLNITLQAIKRLLNRYGVDTSDLSLTFVPDLPSNNDRAFYKWLHTSLPILVDNLNAVTTNLNELNWFDELTDQRLELLNQTVPSGLLLSRHKWSVWWLNINDQLKAIQKILKQKGLVE